MATATTHRPGEGAPPTMSQHQQAISDAHQQMQGGLIAAVGSGWWVVDTIRNVVYNALPPWSIVPPLLFGLAAVWNANTNHRRALREVRREGRP